MSDLHDCKHDCSSRRWEIIFMIGCIFEIICCTLSTSVSHCVTGKDIKRITVFHSEFLVRKSLDKIG